MSNNQKYKNSKKYKCPYCDIKLSRNDLITHIDKVHSDLIPEGYSSSRVVFDFINGKDHGTCMICKKKVYKWNSKINRYYNLCDDPKCRATVREIALKRHIKVYNKPTLLNDPEHQEKMLANRRISGTYVFTDGTKVTYTGKYERNALEFMDKVLNIPSKDIQIPGPILEYDFEGITHKWITDIYYIPANLLIEIKDGGSNPNNRPMQSYRDKQIAKEKMITDSGTFNYIRLTNNDFSQLLSIFADMKNEALENENPKSIIHINEEVGGLPPHRPPEAYIIPYGMNNSFDGFAYTDTQMDKIMTIDDELNIIPMTEDEFNNSYDRGPMLVYIEKDLKEKTDKIFNELKNGNKATGFLYFVEMLVGRKLHKYQEIFLLESFKYIDKDREDKICKLMENGIVTRAENGFSDSNIIKSIGNVMICQSPKGYYAITPDNFYMASEYFGDIESLMSSNVIDLMNDVYNKNSGGVKDDEQ